jgi:tRNA(fMet)-specific endonuclease VapC
MAPDDLGVSTVTIYELLTGVARCRDAASEGDKAAKFLEPLHIVPFDAEAAQQAAKVLAALECAGRIIGPHDLLLAGQSLAIDVLLVTRNAREFRRVPALRLEDWENVEGRP